MRLKIPALFWSIFFISSQNSFSQLNINGAQFTIESGAVVSVQGDLTSTSDILGPGKIVLNGTGNQNVNLGGFTVPNLEVNNSGNATLTGNTRIGTSLLFTNGKILTGDFNLDLSDTASSTGMGAGKFIETNGTGQVIKEITRNVSTSEVPVGAGSEYRPAFVTTTGTYSSANVGVRLLGITDPNSPPSLSDYVVAHWPITRTGITGTVTVAGQYADGDLVGTESNLRGYYFNGTDWSSATGTNTAATNRVSAQIPTAGDLAAMDKFDLLKTKVFLQGAYNSSTGVMSDALRAAGVIPNTDPYRNAPYNATFTHVNNSAVESVVGTPFANSAVSVNDNIVDWVFLELRSNVVSPGNTVLQTRSALIERDGDIVDVDGVSPVTFNNVANANYTIAVRHRNHLGVSADPATNLKALSEKKSTSTVLDFTTATDNNIYGPSTAYSIATDGKNILWAGNANSNVNVKYIGLANDKDYIGVTILGNNASLVLSGVYSPGDVNMNGNVRYIGLANDKDLILVNTLANNAAAQKAQALPN